jgi:hypothetical protein
MTKAQNYIDQIKASPNALDTVWLYQEITDMGDTELLKVVHEATTDKLISAMQTIGEDSSVFMNDPRFAKRILVQEQERLKAEQKKREEERDTGIYEFFEWRKYQDLGILKDGDLIEIDYSYIGPAIIAEEMTLSEAHLKMQPFLDILKIENIKTFYEVDKITGMIMFDDTNGKKSMYFHPVCESSMPLRIFYDNRYIRSDRNGLTKFKIIQSTGE